MITIKCVEESQKFIDENGNLKINEDCRIECDIYVGGNIDVGGNIYARGYIYVGGNIYVGGYIYVGGNIDVGGYIYVGGDMKCFTLYWSHVSMPKIGGEDNIRRVLPKQWQREYWAERLGVSMNGCYDEIIKRIKPRLEEWLKLDKWTSTERWMLEKLQNGV